MTMTDARKEYLLNFGKDLQEAKKIEDQEVVSF